MAYADATSDYKRVILWAAQARAAMHGIVVRDMLAIQAALDNYDLKTGARLTAQLDAHLDMLGSLQRAIADSLTLACVRVAEEISSPALSGGAVRLPEFFEDWRRYQDDVADERVTARQVVFASDPAAADGVQYVRLTVDARGQSLESGLHNETVTAEVIKTEVNGAGAGRAISKIYGEDAGATTFDFGKGSGDAGVEIEQNNEQNGGAMSNPALLVRSNESNGTPVTSSTLTDGWTLTVGSATVQVRTTNPWRTKSYGIAFGGAVSAPTLEQPIRLNSSDGPLLPLCVLRYDGTWEGTITIEWGNKTYSVAHTALGGAGFKYIFPPRNKDLFPINFDDGTSTLKLTLNHTNASGELVVQYLDLLPAKTYQNFYIFSLPHDAVPALGVKKTWADQVTFTGLIQDLTAWAFSEAGWAYLNTSGTNLLTDPAPTAAVMSVKRGVTSITSGGTIALGTTTGAQTVILVIRNTGGAALGVGPAAFTNLVNASGTAVPGTIFGVLPGGFMMLQALVTPAGSGAYSVDLELVNNGGTSPFVVTISGTST